MKLKHLLTVTLMTVLYFNAVYWTRKTAGIIIDSKFAFNYHTYQGVIIIFLLYLVIYLMTNSGIATLLLGNLLSYIFYFANAMKYHQRGELVNFSEFYQITNLKSLSDIVDLSFIFKLMIAVGVISLIVIVLENLIKYRRSLNYPIKYHIIGIILIALFFVPFGLNSERYVALLFGFNTAQEKKSMTDNDVKAMGFFPYFMNNISRELMVPPTWSDDELRSFSKTYTQIAANRNKVRTRDIRNEHTIIYLSESLWSGERLLKNGSPIPYIESMAEKYGGKMYSQYVGGGTGNIEFSVLTSTSLEIHKSPMTIEPFSEYFGKNNTDTSIMSLFKPEGRAVIHPYNFSYYNRLNAYDYMNISHRYDVNTMKYKDKIAGGIRISDLSLTRSLKEIMGDYQLINAISMQNHSPYTSKIMSQSSYISEFNPGILSEVYNGDAYGDYVGLARGYFRGIRESDSAIRELITAMNQSDENINLIVYGDHSPAFVRGKEDKLGKVIHETPYFIYQNHQTNAQAEKLQDIAPFMLIPALLERGLYKMPPYYYLINDIMAQGVNRIGNDYVYINGTKTADNQLNPKLLKLVEGYRALNYDRYMRNSKVSESFYQQY